MKGNKKIIIIISVVCVVIIGITIGFTLGHPIKKQIENIIIIAGVLSFIAGVLTFVYLLNASSD